MLIVLAEPIDGVIMVDTKMLGAERLTAIAEEQSIELEVLIRMIELSRAIGTRGREGTAMALCSPSATSRKCVDIQRPWS